MSEINNIENKLRQIIGTVKSGALKVLAIESERSIRKNFDVGGRPRWERRKRTSKRQKGTNILVITGNMKNVMSSIDGDRVVVKVNPLAREYASIQNFGGEINMPARTLKFRQSKKTGKTVFASSRHKKITKTMTAKAYSIKIPSRPFMVIPVQDYERILNAIKTSIKL